MSVFWTSPPPKDSTLQGLFGQLGGFCAGLPMGILLDDYLSYHSLLLLFFFASVIELGCCSLVILLQHETSKKKARWLAFDNGQCDTNERRRCKLSSYYQLERLCLPRLVKHRMEYRDFSSVTATNLLWWRDTTLGKFAQRTSRSPIQQNDSLSLVLQNCEVCFYWAAGWVCIDRLQRTMTQVDSETVRPDITSRSFRIRYRNTVKFPSR